MPKAHFSVKQICSAALMKLVGQRLSLNETEAEVQLSQLCQFQTGDSQVPNSLNSPVCIEEMHPVAWWKSVQHSKCGINSDLCQLAVTLLNLPSSSASIEKKFSNFGIVQTKLRNRLGVEKAAKLVMCYRRLRGHA